MALAYSGSAHRTGSHALTWTVRFQRRLNGGATQVKAMRTHVPLAKSQAARKASKRSSRASLAGRDDRDLGTCSTAPAIS